MKRRKINYKSTALLVWAIIVFVLVFGSAVALYILGFLTSLFYLNYVYFVLLPVAGGFLLYAIIHHINQRKMYETLLIENQYQLGIGNYFFNYQLFSQRVKQLRKKHKLDKSYIIAFTASNILNSGKLSSYQRQLNGYIASFIGYKIFVSKMVTQDDISFCFHKNVFVLYSFMDFMKYFSLPPVTETVIFFSILLSVPSNVGVIEKL